MASASRCPTIACWISRRTATRTSRATGREALRAGRRRGRAPSCRELGGREPDEEERIGEQHGSEQGGRERGHVPFDDRRKHETCSNAGKGEVDDPLGSRCTRQSITARSTPPKMKANTAGSSGLSPIRQNARPNKAAVAALSECLSSDPAVTWENHRNKTITGISSMLVICELRCVRTLCDVPTSIGGDRDETKEQEIT